MTDVLNATVTPAQMVGDGNGTKRKAASKATPPAAKSDGKSNGKTPLPPVDIKTRQRKK
jgi:hypothetical protein